MTGQIHRLLPRDGSVVMFMLVRGPEGRPTGYPMTGMLRDGGLEITTYRKAPKARYLLADDRVCCVVHDPARPASGVAVYGRAVPAAADGFVAGTLSTPAADAAISVPDEVRDTVRDRLESEKRMVFRIAVERVTEVGSAMAKRDITMTAAETDAFLTRCRQLVVGAIDADGWPIGTIATAAWADGRLSLQFADGDPVRARLDVDPGVCCVADEHESYFEIKGATVHGVLAADDTVQVERVVSFDFGKLR